MVFPVINYRKAVKGTVTGGREVCPHILLGVFGAQYLWRSVVSHYLGFRVLLLHPAGQIVCVCVDLHLTSSYVDFSTVIFQLNLYKTD